MARLCIHFSLVSDLENRYYLWWAGLRAPLLD